MRIEINHRGNMVLDVLPNPNCRKEPSFLKINLGWMTYKSP
jgi:hypothetical protein